MNTVAKKKNGLRMCSLICLALLANGNARAQQPYSFNCKDYISTDNARAPQTAFSYDTKANTFTIKASGQNNVAFKMDPAKDGAYYITNSKRWLLICGQNLGTTSGQSLVWWFNGYNNPGSNADKAMKTTDGKTLLLWDMRNNSGLSGGLDFSLPQMLISANGASFIHAIGLTTATAGSGTISDFNYYENFEAAAHYPSLMKTLGYDTAGKSLTKEVKAKLDSMMNLAQKKLDNASASASGADSLRQALNNASSAYKKLSDTDYATAYQEYLSIQAALLYFSDNNHTFSFERTANGFNAMLDTLHIVVSFYTDDIVRVYKSYNATDTKKSLSVVLSPSTDLTLNYKEGKDTLEVWSDKLRVDYALHNGNMQIFKTSGTQLIEETGASFIPMKDGPNDSYQLAQTFLLDENEAIYGLGQIQNGELNQRGQSISLVQNNMKVCIPYFTSSKGYGLFWDNYSPTTFNDSPALTRFQSTGNEIDYYVMGGDTGKGVLQNMRRLTGQSPMPALWNFGLYQSKERYQSANEVIAVVNKYRSLKVPLDCVVQDWQYWGDNSYWNAMDFLNTTYSNYATMIKKVHDSHAKLMISIWANFGPQTSQFKELNALGRLLPVSTYPTNCGVEPYDAYGSGARDIYWKYLYKGLVAKGIDAYWMDSSEPDYYGGGGTDYDYVTETGQTWRALRNAFPLCHVGGVYTHHRAQAECSDRRVSILTRSAFAGQQRYGANTWSGDVTGSWDNLANQIPAACNLSACGIPYWNSDIGGFFLGSYGGVSDASWCRLYMRWVQFGTFTPMMRFHGTQTPREIYQFGTAGDTKGDYDQILKYIKIRYRMLPYLYSTAWQVTSDGATFMQSLPLAFGTDAKCADVKDEYMFGNSFLVAPVLKDQATSRTVYLPAGQQWYDFWTGSKTEGGATLTKTAPLNIMPLYVPAGTIMPWGPDVQYSTEKQWDNLEVRIYTGKNGQFTLYEDENDNYNYEKGNHSEIPFTWDDSSRTLTIGQRSGSFDGMLQKRTFNIVLVTDKNGFGDEHATKFDATLNYNGDATTIDFSNTAVNNVMESSITKNAIYTLDGIKMANSALSHLPKGFYISNGKKTFIK